MSRSIPKRHQHNGGDIAAGLVAPRRLGRGAPDATTFRRAAGGKGGNAHCRITIWF